MVIRLQDVCKIYRTDDVETHAISHVDLGVEAGEYVAVEGPSGCGKSTLLAIIGLLDRPTTGTCWIAGEEASRLGVSDAARLRNRAIGFVFQNFNLIGDLTVAENVELPLAIRGLGSSERRSLATEALDRVGMTHRSRHRPAQLSGGQQQRVAVARAISGKPPILLADEPTGNLDSKNGEDVMRLLDELHAAGSTIVLVTHDKRYNAMAQRIIQLRDGRVVGDSAMAALARA